MKIVTAGQMRRLEQACVPLGVSLDQLMEDAGLAVARSARTTLGQAAGQRIVILAGPGNNGADGFVAARHLQRWGALVSVHALGRRFQSDPKRDLALHEGISLYDHLDDDSLPLLRRDLDACTLVIDAVLGTGRARPMTGVMRDAMTILREIQQKRPSLQVMALDLPSGLDADTGQTDPASPHADVTLSLGFPKIGLFRFPGARNAGRLEVLNIGDSPSCSGRDVRRVDPGTDASRGPWPLSCPSVHRTPTRAPSATPSSWPAPATLSAQPTSPPKQPPVWAPGS